MDLTVAEYAERLGVSPQRVRELARSGKIDARLEGRAWKIAPGQERVAPRRRPLSERSQADLLTFLDTRSLQHTTGAKRARLAGRLRALQATSDPASLLREYFAGSAPQGWGAAALIRAALNGKDEQVNAVMRNINPSRELIGSKKVADALITARNLKGITVEQVAERAKVPVTLYRRLEAARPVKLGNLYAFRAFEFLGATHNVVKVDAAEEPSP